MVQDVFSDGQRTIFWIGCACIGTYIAYRCWKSREPSLIDEGFEEVSKIDDSHQRKVIVLGLDGAGKTSIMNQACVLNGDQESYTAPPHPTQGCVVHRLKNGSYSYIAWDVGGEETSKSYWPMFFQDIDLLLFVVDASDSEKLTLAVYTLKELLSDSRMDRIPILVIANKQDCSNALRPNEVEKALDLSSISPHKHKVEVIGCQTRPLPELPVGTTEYTWHHPSIETVIKKIFSMAS